MEATVAFSRHDMSVKLLSRYIFVYSHRPVLLLALVGQADFYGGHRFLAGQSTENT